MNSISSRLKAVAVTALAFAAGSFCLLGLVWILGAVVPQPLGGRVLEAYSPHASIAALSDLRAISALSGTFLVLTGLVLLADSAYCDRMTAILADVLLMAMAAVSGFVAGYWILLRLSGYSNFLDAGFMRQVALCPAAVFLASLLPLARLRGAWPTRVGMAAVLLIAGPALVTLLL